MVLIGGVQKRTGVDVLSLWLLVLCGFRWCVGVHDPFKFFVASVFLECSPGLAGWRGGGQWLGINMVVEDDGGGWMAKSVDLSQPAEGRGAAIPA